MAVKSLSARGQVRLKKLINNSDKSKMAITDKRATLQIRICINKILGNKNSINTRVAEMISKFSHGSPVKDASYFTCRGPVSYYVVKKLHSPFLATTVHLPARLAIAQLEQHHGTNIGHLYYSPDWTAATGFSRKRIFQPFSNPFIKQRHKRFYLSAPVCRFID